jgi:hypothetical protein
MDFNCFMHAGRRVVTKKGLDLDHKFLDSGKMVWHDNSNSDELQV